jgi:Fe-S-cluster containining protein
MSESTASLHLPDLHYACVHCGYSCQGLQVELARPEYDALLEQEPAAVEQRGERCWLGKGPDGSCHFLGDGPRGRCRLHQRDGPEAKPTACREFPFRAVATPGGVFVGASFACQSIAQRLGPPLSQGQLQVRTLQLPETPLAPGIVLEWESYLRWEQRLGQLMELQGGNGLWTAALELTLELVGGPPRPPSQAMESDLQAVFRGLLALAEGPLEEAELLNFLTAHAERSSYSSRLLGGVVDLASLWQRWQEPWPLWPQAAPFFEHLLFRKYLLEGPDLHARVCSLPILAQLLQFLLLAKDPQSSGQAQDLPWALRILEERLTFHARGLERYLGRCGRAFLDGLSTP